MARHFVYNTKSVSIYTLMELDDWDPEYVLSDIENNYYEFDMEYEDGQTRKQQFYFAAVPCHFGGHKFFLSCQHCYRRVEDLYRPPYCVDFLCRHCHNLKYASQSLGSSIYYQTVGKVEKRMGKVFKLRNRCKEGSKKHYDLTREFEFLDEARLNLGLKHILKSVR